ncbi:MAG: hypothetical protein CMQ40_12170 [Gammaproteobacteria bacterium]|nr:hypothetical protein [Gammaproteobacteria bacterium]
MCYPYHAFYIKVREKKSGFNFFFISSMFLGFSMSPSMISANNATTFAYHFFFYNFVLMFIIIGLVILFGFFFTD